MSKDFTETKKLTEINLATTKYGDVWAKGRK